MWNKIIEYLRPIHELLNNADKWTDKTLIFGIFYASVTIAIAAGLIWRWWRDKKDGR